MRYQHHGHAALALDPPDDAVEFIPPGRVQPNAWLVEHQHRRLAGQHACQRHPPHLPAAQRERRAWPVLRRRQPDHLQRGGNASIQLRFGQAQPPWPKCDIGGDSWREQLRLRRLKQHPNMSSQHAQVGCHSSVDAIHDHSAGSRAQQRIEMLHQRRFARAGHADDRRAASARDLQADIDKRLPLEWAGLVQVGEVAGDDDRIVHWFACSSVAVVRFAFGSPSTSSGTVALFCLRVHRFSLVERKTMHKMVSTMLPNMLSLPALRLP